MTSIKQQNKHIRQHIRPYSCHKMSDGLIYYYFTLDKLNFSSLQINIPYYFFETQKIIPYCYDTIMSFFVDCISEKEKKDIEYTTDNDIIKKFFETFTINDILVKLEYSNLKFHISPAAMISYDYLFYVMEDIKYRSGKIIDFVMDKNQITIIGENKIYPKHKNEKIQKTILPSDFDRDKLDEKEIMKNFKVSDEMNERKDMSEILNEDNCVKNKKEDMLNEEMMEFIVYNLDFNDLNEYDEGMEKKKDY